MSRTILDSRDAIATPATETVRPAQLVRYRRYGLEVAELFFGDRPPEPLPPLDLLRILGVFEPTSSQRWKRRHTLTVDLTGAEDALFAGMGKSTRYKVRRAMTRDRLRAETFHLPTPAVLREFADYFDEFAPSKDLRPMFRPRLDVMARNGMLVLSRVAREGERPLAWHAYAAGSGHALLMYSASLFRRYADSAERNMSGRANRYLHWHDIVWFKAAGYSAYDLGGIDVSDRDPVTRRINEFKQGFGGRLQPTHACTAALSPKGRLARTLLRLGRVDF